MNQQMTKVMVFGVFDGLHNGHKAMLQQAKSLGDYLVAVVAQDHIVKHIKGHLPSVNMEERIGHLLSADRVDKVIAGDMELGVWEVVKQEEPDIIAVGYDQTLLRLDLEKHFRDFKKVPEIRILDAYEPNEYHSSMLKK